MVQIIPAAAPKRTFMQRLNEGVGKGLEIAEKFASQDQAQKLLQKENEALENLGIHASGIQNPKIRELLTASSLKGEKTDVKSIQKGKELEGAIETLERMRSLRKQGNLGIGTGIRKVYSPETRRHAGEYEQLGKSLISLSSNIPIRNRQEFETLAEKLYDPSVSDDEAEGILSAMERIISNSRSAISDEPLAGHKKQNERPPLTSFMR